MSSFFQDILEGKIDFVGQQRVDHISRIVLIVATILSFFAGFALQSLRVTFGVFGGLTIVLALLVIPPWPMFNRHPVKWLPVADKSNIKTDK